jgi:hypothetical protein
MNTLLGRVSGWGLLLLAVFALVACGGGGGGDGGSGSPPNNLTAVAIAVDTPDPRISHPLTATVSLSADRAVSNVAVSLFAVDDTDDPDAAVRQIPLGSEIIEELPAGRSDHVLNVMVPASVEFSGPYYIAAVVDPVDEIVETDEEDNTASVQATLASTATPNILLADVALDRAALIIKTDEFTQQVPGDVYNADAGGTITVGADGLEVGETVDIEAFANLRITRTDIRYVAGYAAVSLELRRTAVHQCLRY